MTCFFVPLRSNTISHAETVSQPFQPSFRYYSVKASLMRSTKFRRESMGIWKEEDSFKHLDTVDLAAADEVDLRPLNVKLEQLFALLFSRFDAVQSHANGLSGPRHASVGHHEYK